MNPVWKPDWIWWLSQKDTTAIGWTLNPETTPRYLHTQYTSRYGRAGRGRLWVEEWFGEVSIDPWPNTRLANLLVFDYGGIVFRHEELPDVRRYPGIITDLELRPLWELERQGW